MSSSTPTTPTVQSLGDLLSYQENAVVSRILLKNRGGTVTLFAFGKGEELSEHSTPHDALVLVTDGEVEVTISGQPYRVHAGESLHLPATQPHALKAISDFKMVLVMLKSKM